MRLIFVNRFYWPEENATSQLLVDLAEALAALGHTVTILTSRPAGSALPTREIHHGVTIRRVAGTRWQRLGLPGKAVDFLTFYVRVLGTLLFTAQRGDAVVALTDPPLLGIGAWLAARFCGARIFHWVQDIYPEIATHIGGHAWVQLFSPLRNFSWRRSDGCMVLGADMAALVSATGVAPDKITVSPNWAPAGLDVQPHGAADGLRKAWGLEGKFVVAYSGNLGRVHDLEPVLEAATQLRNDPDIAFVFIGGGAQRAHVQSIASARGLAHVHFHPAQPRADLARTLALGDLHLVTLLPGCAALVFPSKLYGIAAVGRPVAFVGPPDCEIARLIESHGLGRAFDRNDVDGLSGYIRELRATPELRQRLGAAAARFYRDETGLPRAVSAWEKRLTSVT